MIKDIIVGYDEVTGGVYDGNGSLAFTYIGLQGKDVSERKSDDVLELVKQGLTADDLVKLKNMGII